MTEQREGKKDVAHRRVERGALAKYLTVAQAASTLGLSRPTVYAMIKRGQLPARRVGGQWFVAPSAIVALLPPEGTPKSPAQENTATNEQKPG